MIINAYTRKNNKLFHLLEINSNDIENLEYYLKFGFSGFIEEINTLLNIKKRFGKNTPILLSFSE